MCYTNTSALPRLDRSEVGKSEKLVCSRGGRKIIFWWAIKDELELSNVDIPSCAVRLCGIDEM